MLWFLCCHTLHTHTHPPSIPSSSPAPFATLTHHQVVDVQAAAAAAAGSGAATSSRIELGGHRSDVRAMALSPDDQLLLTASSSALKLWNPRSGACLATMESGYGLCVLFAPGGKYAVVGTKVGCGGVREVCGGGLRAGRPASLPHLCQLVT